MRKPVKSVYVSLEMKQLLDIIYAIPEESFNHLIARLGDAHPTTSRTEMEGLIRNNVPGLIPKYHSKIVDLMIEISIVVDSEEIPVDEYMDHLLDLSPYSPQDKEEHRKRLSALVRNTKAVSLISKARDLWSELPRKLFTSRILSDVRPFFGNDPNKIPAHGLVVHTLVLSYEESSVQKEFHVSFDRDALLQLQFTIKRALQKEDFIQSMMREINVPLIPNP